MRIRKELEKIDKNIIFLITLNELNKKKIINKKFKNNKYSKKKLLIFMVINNKIIGNFWIVNKVKNVFIEIKSTIFIIQKKKGKINIFTININIK